SSPTCAWFMQRLHHIFPASTAGHSLNAGGATSLSAAGVPPSQIQVIGCWVAGSLTCGNNLFTNILCCFKPYSFMDVPLSSSLMEMNEKSNRRLAAGS
ncbi:hypothetical protein BDN67DRAFT_910176, partial [Paxillus ammoniavirescens]